MRYVISLGTIKEATGHEAITRYLEESVLPNTDWNLVKVRRKSVRLEPPHAYWATYTVQLGRGDLVYPEPDAEPVLETRATDQPALDVAEAETEAELPQPSWTEERELRLVARGVFDSQQWQNYLQGVESVYATAQSDPLRGLARPAVFPDTQHVLWFFPADPNMPYLSRAADPEEMTRVFRNRREQLLDYPARISEVRIELARYLPEISAILRYEIETVPSIASTTIFGKVQPWNRGEESHRVMTEIWKAAEQSEGRLTVPRPMGYLPELGLYLQSAVKGTPLSSNRTRPEFLPGSVHAAEAIAAIHDFPIPTEKSFHIEHEIARLDKVLDQFAIVHPKAYFLLRELLAQLRERVRKLPEEERLSTHGDLKYDQLLHHAGKFSLIDFDYFARGETSYDLAKFCAYLVPSMPKGWEQSVAAEEARKAFLDRYRELRPQATLQRFQAYETINLAGRAMTLMWTQARGWQQAAESILVIGMERLKSKLP